MQAAPDVHAWLGIELRHLAALQAVAEERSFVRAGKRLGYTQSAISNQIAALERLTCTRLVERVRGGSTISLTEPGRVLYEHAVALIARLQAARLDVAAAWPALPAGLRVGYCQTVGAALLPRTIRVFREQAPSVRLDLTHGETERLLELVVAGELDAAFVSAPAQLNGIGSARLLDDPFVLLAPPGSRWPLEPDFARRPLLACKPCEAQRVHESALQLSHGLPQGGVVWLDDALTIQSLVAAGCAYGLLPSLAVTSTELSIELLEGPRREVDLVWQRERTATEALCQFVEAARHACSSDGWSDGSGAAEARTAA